MQIFFNMRDGSQTTDPRLGRLEHFDERSRAYGVAPHLASSELVSRMWDLPRRLFVDQGVEGACVGAAWTHELLAAPARTGGLDMQFAREVVYHGAQRIDEWPGGSYPGASPRYEGTSVLAGAKIVQGLGFIGAYRWAFGIDELALAVGQLGPAVIGVPWLDGMFEPRPSGLLEVEGSVVGGHAVLVRGVQLRPRLRGDRPAEPVAVIAQSWGLDHGDRGQVYVRLSDLARLLGMGGEACIPELRDARPPRR